MTNEYSWQLHSNRPNRIMKRKKPFDKLFQRFVCWIDVLWLTAIVVEIHSRFASVDRWTSIMHNRPWLEFWLHFSYINNDRLWASNSTYLWLHMPELWRTRNRQRAMGSKMTMQNRNSNNNMLMFGRMHEKKEHSFIFSWPLTDFRLRTTTKWATFFFSLSTFCKPLCEFL